MTRKVPLRPTRTRAIAHMQRLLSASAAVAVADANAACHKEKADKKPDASLSVTDRDHGYTVVDPVPRPRFCPDIAPLVTGTAKKVGDAFVITLSLAKGRADFKYVADAPATAYQGTIVKSLVDDKGITVTVRPQPGQTYVNVSVKGTCDNGPATLSAYVDPATLAVTISEY